MMSEEMLALAAEEVAEAMVSSVPTQEHTFSPSFLRRMRTLIRRAEQPARYRFLRQAAVLVAVITAFALLYMTSPTVQAAVNSWIRDTFGIYIQYAPAETTPPDAQYDYALPEEFDGYTLLDAIDRGEDFFYVYVNEDGQMLFFDYLRNNDGSATFINTENSIQEHGTVGKYAADIYISKNPEDTSIIVWVDTDTNVLLTISAIEEKDDLIAYAEKVEKFLKLKIFPYK